MILFIDLAVAVVICLILLFFFRQVIVPLRHGTPLFPWFRKTPVSEKMKAASKELEEVAELEQLDDLEEELNRRKAQLKKET